MFRWLQRGGGWERRGTTPPECWLNGLSLSSVACHPPARATNSTIALL